MTIARFAFQRRCVEAVNGVVLNVGCNEDPADLKNVDRERVINCDIERFDSYMDGRVNKVDIVFDCREPWPFHDDEAELVVFGDILEHLYPWEAIAAMKEAHRVAEKVCITVPKDDRFISNDDVEIRNGYRTHCYVWDEDRLSMLLDESGFGRTFEWHTVHYDFVPEGYFVLAGRD